MDKSKHLKDETLKHVNGGKRSRCTRYRVNSDKCEGCGACMALCPCGAVEPDHDKFKITDSCIRCGICKSECPLNAIEEVY